MNLIDTYKNSNAYNKQVVKNMIDQIVSRNKPMPIISSTNFEEGFILRNARNEEFIMTDPPRIRGQRADLIYYE